ncbi:hypothetical protein IWW48_003445 [Coemansia sp. RSA 1200]|nr:hypothetical protein IWW48_003445 [Coemansia sp. RSA 1200]
MSNNLDLALDDIIKAESRNSGGRHNKQHRGHRGHSRRGSPYSRNNDNGRGSDRTRWSHDLFDGPKSINDRLSGERTSINSRLRGAPNESKTKDNRLARGITIAGRTRNTSLYDSMRAVWVINLPHNYDSDKIKDLFSDVGRVDNVRMAIDRNGRFIGKAEIVYRIPEDARSAIQRFDGEGLYTTDAIGIKTINVAYSSIERADFIDNLKFESTLPSPRKLPMEMRLGGVGSSTMVAMNMMAAQQMAAVNQGAGWSGSGHSGSDDGTQPNADNRQRNSMGSHQRNGWKERRQHRGNGRQNQPTMEELDAEMDVYMKGGAEASSSNSNIAASGTMENMENGSSESKVPVSSADTQKS